MRIDGRAISRDILKKLHNEVLKLKQYAITPHLAIILVGNDPPSEAYVLQKKRKGEAIGMKVTVKHLQQSVKIEKLLATIKQWNSNDSIHGIIIQQPLPQHIDIDKLIHATCSYKDVDGFHPKSPFTPPIAEAVLQILDTIRSNVEKKNLGTKQGSILKAWLEKKNIVIIGKGETGGAPIIAKLKELGVDLVVIDSKTQHPDRLTRHADIIISCVGRPRIVQAANIKKGVILLSVGMSRGGDGKLHGDYEEDEIKDVAMFYTPVPGGIGPVNVAMLLRNVLVAAKRAMV